MNDLEDRVRAALHDRAGYQGVQTMPSVTRGQVRKREAWFLTTVSVVAASAIAVGALLLQSLPHAAPARDVATDGFTSPLEVVPEGWPVVGFMPKDDDAGRGCFEYAPPWNGQPGSAGVMGSCVGAPDVSVPNGTDLDLLGFSSEAYGQIEADMGFVSPRVERISIQPEGGSAFQIPILKGPEGWDARFFLTFFYEGMEGEVVAYAADGTVLARSSLCAVVGHSGSCRGRLQQIAALP